MDLPTPGVPVISIRIANSVMVYGAPAGTFSFPWKEAFEPGPPDRESGILSSSNVLLRTGLYYRTRRGNGNMSAQNITSLGTPKNAIVPTLRNGSLRKI